MTVGSVPSDDNNVGSSINPGDLVMNNEPLWADEAGYMYDMHAAGIFGQTGVVDAGTPMVFLGSPDGGVPEKNLNMSLHTLARFFAQGRFLTYVSQFNVFISGGKFQLLSRFERSVNVE